MSYHHWEEATQCFACGADGNRTSATNGTTPTSTFDYEDRLTGIGSTASYDYIGASTDRFSKTTDGTTTNFLYDRGSVTEEMQGTAVTAEFGADAQELSNNARWTVESLRRPA